MGEEGIFIKAQIGLLCDNLCAPFRGAVICSLGIRDREPVHETQLKFCSAGEALVWQSFILGRERGAGGLLRACSPCLLPALPAAALAKGWTRELGVEAMHAACPCDTGEWAWKAAVPTSKEIWGQGCNPAFPEDRFPTIFSLQSGLV